MIQCQAPETPRAAILVYDHPSTSAHTLGSRVNYRCEKGFEITNGTATRQCQENGEWDGTEPVCSSKRILKPIQNADLVIHVVINHRTALASPPGRSG